MSRPRHPRTDSNQAEIIAGLRQLGMVVWDVSSVGGRVLDLVVHWRGVTRVVEVKHPHTRNNLTDGERESIGELAGVGVAVIVAATVEEVIKGFEEDTDGSA